CNKCGGAVWRSLRIGIETRGASEGLWIAVAGSRWNAGSRGRFTLCHSCGVVLCVNYGTQDLLFLMKRIAILGSTGSIGRSTLSVIESHPQRFQLITMAAGGNIDAALEQARRWKPKVLSLASEKDAESVRKKLKAEGLRDIEVVHGQAGSVRVATY